MYCRTATIGNLWTGRWAEEGELFGDQTIRVRHSLWTNRCSDVKEKPNGCLPRTRDRVTFLLMARRPSSTTTGPAPIPSASPIQGGPLTARQRQVLEFIDAEVRQRGYPPSVREIGDAVGLSSSSTVHAHLGALQDKGYLVRDPTKPRAIEVRFE